MIKYFSILLGIVFCFQFECISQDRHILIFDKANKNPVEYAFVYSERYNDISDHKGSVVLPNCSKEEEFRITHINYYDYNIKCEDLVSGDTIFLISKSYELDEVSVVAHKTTTDYYRILNRIFKKYQKSSLNANLSYNYFLRTILGSKIVERINANISVNYKVGDELTLPNKWLNSGNFEFTKESPFISLDIDQLILRLQPFYKSGTHELLTSKKINKKECVIELVECAHCNEQEIKLSINSNDQRCIVVIDPLNAKIISASYTLLSNSYLSFFSLFDGSNISFNHLALNYRFDKDGLPLQIDGEISLEYYSLPIKTKFVFFNKILNNEYDFDVLGNPSFSNIYEQLIFQPNPDYSHINSQYFFSDTALLAKFQESFRKQFLESSVFNDQYRYLDSNMDSLPISINLIHDDFFIDKYGKFKKIESNLKVYQSIVYQQDTTISIYPILDLVNSKIYTKIDDPYINQWALNLVCFSYRQDQTEISSIANKNVNPKEMISDFEQNRILYNDFLNSTLLQNKNTIRQLLKVNSAIDSSSNYNVFKHLINKDFGCFECKENLISEIIKQGYRAKRKKDIKNSHTYFEYGIIRLNQLIDEVNKDTETNKKLIGSFYSRLAELHIELNHTIEACSCLTKYRSFWPEGFILSQKREYYHLNCVE